MGPAGRLPALNTLGVPTYPPRRAWKGRQNRLAWLPGLKGELVSEADADAYIDAVFQRIGDGVLSGPELTELQNLNGEVFEANVDDLEQELPRLSGPLNQAATVLAMYRALLPVFDAVDLPLTDLEMSNRGSWRVTLDTGAVIELGRGQEDEVTARTQRFLKTVTQVTSRYGRRLNALESADLRYEDGYAIRLRGVTTGTEVKKK